MRFYELLEKYITEFGSSNRELAQLSGVSSETISRYRRGIREPYPESKSLSRLAYGLFRASQRCGLEIPEEEILSSLSASLDRSTVTDPSGLNNNLRLLMENLGITNKELARNICFDPSYISRILSGKRRPSDMNKFITDTAEFIASKTESTENLSALAHIIGCEVNDIADKGMRIRRIICFLSPRQDYNSIHFASLLERMDEFDIEQYVSTMKSDHTMNLPAAEAVKDHKSYAGMKEVMQSELDFISLTSESDSKESVIFYTDIPIKEMMGNKSFARKWIFGMTLLLKKGLELKVIHDLSRPIGEMIIGLETYLPMYMTGQITPYYFSDNQSSAFHHILRVSGAAVVAGGAIEGFRDSAHCRVTTDKNEIKFFRKTGEQLLSLASPLMEIYREDRVKEFGRLLNNSFEMKGVRRMYMGAPPLFTIPDELLDNILKRNNVSESKKNQIREYLDNYRAKADIMLKNEYSYFQFPICSLKEFENHPISLIIPEIFYEDNICYTYEEYLAHIRNTAYYLNRYPNAELDTSVRQVFRNIVISVIGNELAVISKSRRPSIHFVLRHPRLIDAINNFYIPVPDEQE